MSPFTLRSTPCELLSPKQPIILHIGSFIPLCLSRMHHTSTTSTHWLIRGQCMSNCCLCWDSFRPSTDHSCLVITYCCRQTTWWTVLGVGGGGRRPPNRMSKNETMLPCFIHISSSQVVTYRHFVMRGTLLLIQTHKVPIGVRGRHGLPFPLVSLDKELILTSSALPWLRLGSKIAWLCLGKDQ